MESVEKHYPVVLVLEELDKSLFVMQKLLPRFFHGIWDLFGGGKASEYNKGFFWTPSLRNAFLPVHGNHQSYKSRDLPDTEVESVIKSQLKTEYEFYEFLKRRLSVQAESLLFKNAPG